MRVELSQFQSDLTKVALQEMRQLTDSLKDFKTPKTSRSFLTDPKLDSRKIVKNLKV